MADRRSDSELVRTALAGSRQAFGELVARYKDAVFGVAFHHLGDFEEARDAAQDTFIKAFQNLANLKRPSSFAHWLYRLANGTALDAARRSRRHAPLADDVPAASPREPADQSDLARQVRDALAALTEPSRLAVILHYVDGYTHAEVAQFLGTTPGAVKTRVSRARSRLREEMANMVEDRLKKESAVFHYEATDDSGRVVLGTTDGESASAVRNRLRGKGYRVRVVRRDDRTPEEREAEEGKPIERVARVIIEQALKDAALQIRVKLPHGPVEQPMTISYLIKGKWHEVMAVPKYVWQPLRAKLAEMAGIELAEDGKRQSGTIQFNSEDRDSALKGTFNPRSIRIDLPVPE